MLTALFVIVVWLIGAIIAQVIFRCGNMMQAAGDDETNIAATVMWPLALAMMGVFGLVGLIVKTIDAAATFLTKKICPNTKTGE